MGRNGAGKSTLLRHAAGLLEPTRGRVERAGRVALLLQNPGDYFIHERVGEEASAEALAAAGLGAMAERHPRDLSGGERQRLALAIVTGGGRARRRCSRSTSRRAAWTARPRPSSPPSCARAREEGQAVIVATHDPEFAAACADRAVLLADGRVIADGPARGAARRRLVLRHRDRAHPRRRRRRAAAGGGRGAAAPAAAPAWRCAAS